MSRTHHHGDRNKDQLYGHYRKWYRQEPKWWRSMVKHRPQRAKARICQRRVLKGEEVADWPLDKKPWIYYW